VECNMRQTLSRNQPLAGQRGSGLFWALLLLTTTTTTELLLESLHSSSAAAVAAG